MPAVLYLILLIFHCTQSKLQHSEIMASNQKGNLTKEVGENLNSKWESVFTSRGAIALQIFGRVVNLILCAITIWQIVAITRLPPPPQSSGAAPPATPKFRHGDFQQGQIQLDNASQRDDIFAFLVTLVGFVIPTEILYLKSLCDMCSSVRSGRSKESVPGCLQKSFGTFFCVRIFIPSVVLLVYIL